MVVNVMMCKDVTIMIDIFDGWFYVFIEIILSEE